MTAVWTIISTVLVLAGLIFLVGSTIGLLRLPDLYTRAHAVAKSETLGLALLFGGLLFHPELDIQAGLRLAFVLVASLILNPTAVHALIRAAHRAGALPMQTVDQASAQAEVEAALRGPAGGEPEERA